MAAMEYRKTYVEVLCRIDVDGQVTPLSIIWRDGRTFPIDRVEEAIRRASARVGGTGVRYRVSINGRDKYQMCIRDSHNYAVFVCILNHIQKQLCFQDHSVYNRDYSV